MEYRKLGRTGLDVGVIGLGTEHLENSRDTVERVVEVAIDGGINCIDVLSSDPHRDEFNTDFWDNIGPVLRANRHRFVLLARWGDPVDYSDLDRCRQRFEDLLACVGNDYVEVGMLFMVDTDTKWNEWGQRALEHLRRYQAEGRIGYIGMSSHRATVSIKAVNSGVIDVLLYPFNLTSHAKEGDGLLLQACVDRDVGLVAMKPYGGGRLLRAKGDNCKGLPTPIQCLHYLLSLPVSATVPGVSNAEHLRDALCYWEASDEDKTFDSFLPYVHDFLAGECAYCNHCLPCPQGIAIGHTIFMVDEVPWSLFDEYAQEYADLEVKASACVECGECLMRCPFDVDIIAKMQEAVALFETG